MSMSRVARRCSLPGRSKMAPELGHPDRQRVDVALEVAEHQAARFQPRAASDATETTIARYAIQSPRRE